MNIGSLEVGYPQPCPVARIRAGSPLVTAVLAVVLSLASLSAVAQDISHGELAGAIRAAGKPCHQVIDEQAVSESSWLVTCNSGGYSVSRDKAGKLNVSGAG